MLGSAGRIVTTSASYLYSWIFKRPADGGVLLLNEAEKPTVDYIEGQTDMLSPSAAEAEEVDVARAYMGEEVTRAITPARVSLTTVGSKKRGSAVLEDGGYSSGGPIRRLRPRSSSMMNDKACQTMKSWDFLGPQDLDEAGSDCNLENDLSHGFSWKGTEQSQTTTPTASIASSAFGEDKFVPTSSLPCPAFDAPSCAPLETARERVDFAYTILDLLYSVLQWPTRAELIAQYPHQVDYDRSQERAVQQLLMAAGECGNFINLVIDRFVFVFLDLVESGPSDNVAYSLEDLSARILSGPEGVAYVLSLSTFHQVRLGLIFFRSAWRRKSDL